MIVQAGAEILERTQSAGKPADLVRLGETEIEFAPGEIVEREKFLFDLVRHGDEILRAVAQKGALLGELDAKAVAQEELFAELVLQAPERLRERRLRDVQELGGAGHVLLARDGEKIAQGADLHRTPSMI